MKHADRPSSSPITSGATRDDPETVRRIDIVRDRLESRDLFVATREIMIVHGTDTYRLRLTAQNKLILTK
ncbi:hemin uptake protein HemP [Rhodovulum sp. PH10]|uniref:hemin uptake protein HemP n=1 Tax=Rhodovulum sp. PH10 TaxID=1187851 RepID=UPI00058DCD18|nr:hemin uptake protein HemP [Rhodovulum sp. PH10]